MHYGKLKASALVFIMPFFFSCVTTTTYVAPHEVSGISAPHVMVVTALADDTLRQWTLCNVCLEGDKLIGYMYYSPSHIKKEINVATIKSVGIKKVNAAFVAPAVLYTGVAIVGALLLHGQATAPSPPPPSGSCPYLYSFNGESFVFDAEPFGAAICRGLKRTEWCGLEHLQAIDGYYRLRMQNELPETQYLDEIKLLLVDHPPGMEIVPDVAGGIHTFTAPIQPSRVYDGHGADQTSFYSGKDGIFWQSRLEGRDPDNKNDLYDTLIFEFPKPAGASQAKLLFNACTTPWGAEMGKRFLELYGRSLPARYRAVDSHGPAYVRLMDWYAREELYQLKIQVQTPTGWKDRGTMLSNGPFSPKDKAYVLDISDVTGDRLKIKLAPPVNFWRMDYLAVDYGEDIPVKVTELQAVSVYGDAGQDVRQELAENDDQYVVLPEIGDSTGLVFSVPPIDAGRERAVILKASGYYQAHIQAKGWPHWATLRRLDKHGFAAEYALQEYQKWKDKNPAFALYENCYGIHP